MAGDDREWFRETWAQMAADLEVVLGPEEGWSASGRVAVDLVAGSSVVRDEEVSSVVAGQVEAAASVRELRALLVASGLESWELPMMVGKVDRLNQPIAVIGFVPAGTVRRVSAVLRAGLVARRRPPATGS